MVADTLLVLDNLYNRATVIANVEVPASAPEPELRRLFDAGRDAHRGLARPSGGAGDHRPAGARAARACPRPRRHTPDQRFQDDVRRIKEYIAAGDTFQTVLSRRLDLPAPDPFLTYRYLRALNPAPYLYYLHCDDVHVIGSSPEILVRVEDARGHPAAHRRHPAPRGRRRSRMRRWRQSSTADPKERAEHLMLVDLGRNDVGRVAEFGIGAAHRRSWPSSATRTSCTW